MKKKTANRLYRLVAMVVFCCGFEAVALCITARNIDQKRILIAAQQSLIDTLFSDVERESKKFKEMRDYSWKLERKIERLSR